MLGEPGAAERAAQMAAEILERRGESARSTCSGAGWSLGPVLFRALYSTLKFDIKGRDNQESWEAGQPVVFVTWHGRLLPLLHLYRRRGS